MTKTALDPAFRQIIAQFRDSKAWDEELDLRLLEALWPRIAGPGLARSTTIVGLEGDRIVIRVPDRTWKQELLAMRQLLLRRINEPWPGRGIRQIQFIHEDNDR